MVHQINNLNEKNIYISKFNKAFDEKQHHPINLKKSIKIQIANDLNKNLQQT